MNEITVDLQSQHLCLSHTPIKQGQCGRNSQQSGIELSVSPSFLQLSQTKNGAFSCNNSLFRNFRFSSLKCVWSLHALQWKSVCSFDSSPETTYWLCGTCSIFSQSFFYQPSCIIFRSGGCVKPVKGLWFGWKLVKPLMFDTNTQACTHQHTHTRWARWV